MLKFNFIFVFFVNFTLISLKLNSSPWLYYQNYPWVYDNKNSEWLYLKAMQDNNIYAYHANEKNWKLFNPTESSPSNKSSGPHISVNVQSADNLEMIWVSPGSFTMGNLSKSTNILGLDETPHKVSLTDGFYLGKYEVTQNQYEVVMNSKKEGSFTNPSYFTGKNKPVESVSWEDIQIFLSTLTSIEKLSGRLSEGWLYSLPTEAQWEFAARAGTISAYSVGNDLNYSHANFSFNGHKTGYQKTLDVGSYPPNSWGFHDMHGNVWEWTADKFQDSYPSSAVINPSGPNYGILRVSRGGSWNNTKEFLRSAQRYYNTPKHRNETLGFRLALRKLE